MPFPDLQAFLLEAFSDIRAVGLRPFCPHIPDPWTPVKRAKQREYRARRKAAGISREKRPWSAKQAEQQRQRHARPEVRARRNKQRQERRAKAREERARGLVQSR